MSDIDPSHDIAIDKYALDKEWVQLPALYFDYSSKEADAKSRVNELSFLKDKAYAECKRTLAQISLDVRANPAAYGVTKVTEVAIDQAALASEAYGDAQKALQDVTEQLVAAQKVLEDLSAAKWALEIKKKALEGLTQLWVSNYFQDRSENKHLQEASRANTAEHQQDNLNRRMIRRVRTSE